MSNEIITLIKDTALANCIMVCEIIKQAKELAATKALIWPLFYTGVFYLLFVGLLTIILGKLERLINVKDELSSFEVSPLTVEYKYRLL